MKLIISVSVIVMLNLSPVAIASDPLFENSIVSTTIDFIHTTDNTVESDLCYRGHFTLEMPDRRNDDLLREGASKYLLIFHDETEVEVWSHPDFDEYGELLPYIELIRSALGKLPVFMRDKLSHVVLHKGNEAASSEHLGHFIVVYSENIKIRSSNNDFEETIFHETVHATLDEIHAKAETWYASQLQDNGFATQYAAAYPDREDLAETALFVYTMKKYPERLAKKTREWMNTHIPNRVRYINQLIDDMETYKPVRESFSMVTWLKSFFDHLRC